MLITRKALDQGYFMATSFFEMASEGVNYFHSIFKEESRETILLVIDWIIYFQDFLILNITKN